MTSEETRIQCERYFDSLDSFTKKRVQPSYAKDVIRWEWEPWLKLTGWNRSSLLFDTLIRLYPTRVINRRYEITTEQPAGRCFVEFKYLGRNRLVPIYEEFTFNEEGELIFIEAWSLTPEIQATLQNDSLKRMSAQLGKYNYDVKDFCTSEVNTNDPDVADFVKRMHRPVFFWFAELFRAVLKPKW